ncbi:helix-turn-helix domain-containing protein [Halomarina rubra]|uniref:Helix-turn-helix domain-containing protein n=1 Tax=Halomarina rubra TaxID=2071873 RepID=A0ABD6ARH8_9EURY|nr:helix-turn-helix domain-containing protein [Halomarina rubra]
MSGEVNSGGPVIVEYTFQQPTLMTAVQQFPDVRIEWEASSTTPNNELLMLFWVTADDFDAFEAAMHDDSTVTAPSCLTEFADRRLYQVEQIEEGRAKSIYDTLVAVGGIVDECVGTHRGWRMEVEFPSNDALQHFHETCRELDLEFDLIRKYEPAPDNEVSNHYGLTPKQRDALVYAAEMGYFEVPRAVDLDTISEKMNISHQAASERIRRAMDILIDHTVAPARTDDG